MKIALRALALGSLLCFALPACGSGTGDTPNVGGSPSAGAMAMAGSVASGGADPSSGSNAGGAGSDAVGGSSAGAGGLAPGGSDSGGAAAGLGGVPGGGAGIGGGGANAAGADVGGAAGSGGGSNNGVEQWHPFDITLGGTSSNQLTDSLSATFKGPTGQTLKLPGFYDGAAGWKVRFSPIAIGTWTYTTASSIAALNAKTGSITCVANKNPLVHGRMMVDAAHPHYFKYEDGTPYVLMAFEADWLGLLDFGNAAIPKAKALVDMYVGRGFNHVLLNVYAYDTTWRAGKSSPDDFGPPTDYPWKGSNSAPDQSQINPSFFANYDRVMQYLFDRGVGAHVMIKVYNKGVNWPAKGSKADDLFFTHVLARYQAYPNLMWDFSKESNNETDIAYKSGRIQLMRDQDAYHHPVSTHTDLGYYSNAASNGLLDFRTDQNQAAYYSTIISHRNADPWPVMNSEYDYEIGNDGGKTYSHANDKLTVLKNACEVTMAGGHIAYYYTYHAWDVVRVAEVPGGLGYYKNLYSMLSSTKWSELAPADTLISGAAVGRHCLAKEGAEYLVYLVGTGSTSLAVKLLPAGSTLKGKWLNLVSGQEQAIAATPNGQATLTNPWSDPALAHLAP